MKCEDDKAMTNLESVLKSRDITLPTNVHTVQAVVFPVVTYGCESWTVKKAECQRLMPLNCGAGEDSWVPWTARSNQSILREINPKYSLEGLTLKLKLQYLGHLMQIAGSLEKSLMLGKIEGRRRRGHQSMRWLDGITDAMDMHLGKLCEMVKDREAWHIAVYGAAKGWTGLGNWTTRNKEVKDREWTV